MANLNNHSKLVVAICPLAASHLAPRAQVIAIPTSVPVLAQVPTVEVDPTLLLEVAVRDKVVRRSEQSSCCGKLKVC